MGKDSYIQLDRHGATSAFVGDDAMRMYSARVLASSLELYRAAGIVPTRGVTLTMMLAQATALTKKPYERSQALEAQADVTKWADEMLIALPVLDHEGQPR